MKRLAILILLIMGCDNSTEPQDCAGVVNGTAVLSGCDNACNSTAIVDCAGVCGGSSINDIEGNCYATVQIGEQLWMKENLKTTKYRDGTPIPSGHTYSDWIVLSTGAYAIYPADSPDDNTNFSETTCGDNCADIYGNLYNWYAVDDSKGLCPDGWHVSTDNEWKELEIYLGMSQDEANDINYRGTNEGSKLAGNVDLWANSTLEENSEFSLSGFSAFPGGYRYTNPGGYTFIGESGIFWSSSESSSSTALVRSLNYDRSTIGRYDNRVKKVGYSIRCLADN